MQLAGGANAVVRPSVVTLAPSLADMVIAAGGLDHLAGVSYFSSVPPKLHIARVGIYTNPDLEKIIALQPDLVLISTEGNPPHIKGALERAGVKTLVVTIKNIEDIFSWIKKLGHLFHSEPVAKETLNQAKKILSIPPCPSLTAMALIEVSPPMAAGKDTFIHDLLTKAGLKNAADYGRGYFYLDAEKLQEINPEVIILPSSKKPDVLLQLLPRTGFIHVNDNNLMRPGPGIFKALERIKKWCSSHAR